MNNNSNINIASLDFNKIQELANNGNPEAMYYVANSFTDGKGYVFDPPRYNFWLKKSADCGYVVAEYVYAMSLINHSRYGSDAFADGMNYLKMAADAGYPYAVRDYVQVVDRTSDNEEYVANALRYNSMIASRSNDAFEKQRCSDIDNRLNIRVRDKKNYLSKMKFYKVFRIIGPILLMLGFLYWFGGIHPDEWDDNVLLKFIPGLNLIFKSAAHSKDVLFGPNGIFGVLLILIAFILIFTSKPSKNRPEKYAAKSLYAVAIIISLVFCLWHFLVQLIQGDGLFSGLLIYLLVFIVCNITGRLISKLIRKLAKWDN